MIFNNRVKEQYVLIAPYPESYAIPFPYWEPGEIHAVLSRDTGDEELVQDLDFTVTPADGENGTLTRLSSWDGGLRLTVYRATPRTQEVDLENGRALFAELIEKVADKNIAIVQELHEVIERIAQFPITDPPGSVILPPREYRLNKFMAFDENGDPIPVEGQAGGAPVSDYMKTVLVQEDPEEARTALGVVKSVLDGMGLAAATAENANFATEAENANTAENANKLGNYEPSVQPAPDTVLVRNASGGIEGFEDLIKQIEIDRFNRECPVGSFYVQYPDGPSPENMAPEGVDAVWEVWSDRVVKYGLYGAAPPDGFAQDLAVYGADIWSLNTNGSVATAGTKKYTKPADYLYVFRQDAGNGLEEDDWEVGYKITDGTYMNLYVWEPLSFAGTFPSVEGGNRPTFVSGGVQPYQMPRIQGYAGTSSGHAFFSEFSGALTSGPLGAGLAASGTSPGYYKSFSFDNASVVGVGPDVAGTNLSTRFWRRLPDHVSG
jgi:hypothetical protein